ncbi:MAG: ribosome maturation factor RimM [Desulfonatronovibrionaceae bacterium]
MAGKDLVHCGRVIKPHGLKGELRVFWHADSPVHISQLPRLYLRRKNSGPRAFNIRSSREHQGAVLVFLENISGRDQAEGWRDADIFISARYLPPKGKKQPDSPEPGFSVFLPGGHLLGTLEAIACYSGSPVWTIITPHGAEILFPGDECFIMQTFPDVKKVVVDPPQGLLEICITNPPEPDSET